MTLQQVAAKYAEGLRNQYKKNPPACTSIDVAIAYALEDWMNDIKRMGGTVEMALEDLAYWEEKWAIV